MTILCYHAIDPAWRSPLSVPPDDFAAQVRWLVRRRTVVPLDAALGRRGSVAITFDDGFRSVLEHALPVLADHGVPATVFVVTGTLTGDKDSVDWVDDPPPWPLGTLTVEELGELRRHGVDVASHTHNHPVLTAVDDNELDRELRTSREVLEDLMGSAIPFLAYPRGFHDERVRAAALRAGYSHAFSLPESPEPAGRFAVPRVGIYPGNGIRSLWAKTQPWYLRARTSRLYPAIRRAVRGSAPPTRRAG